jgi:transposase-like protein
MPDHPTRSIADDPASEGWTIAAVAAAFGIDANAVRKWRDRHAAVGEAGL